MVYFALRPGGSCRGHTIVLCGLLQSCVPLHTRAGGVPQFRQRLQTVGLHVRTCLADLSLFIETFGIFTVVFGFPAVNLLTAVVRDSRHNTSSKEIVT